MQRLVIFLLGISLLPLGVLAQAPTQPTSYTEFLKLEESRAQIIQMIEEKKEQIQTYQNLIRQNINDPKSNVDRIDLLQKDINLSKKVLATIAQREKELATIINTDSFIIMAPDIDTAKQINSLANEARRDIYSSVLGGTTNRKPSVNPLKIKMITTPVKISTSRSATAFVRPIIATDFDTNGKPFQYILCIIEMPLKNGRVLPLDDSCKGTIRHELTHAFFDNAVWERLGNRKSILEIPAALHEGLAVHMDSADMQDTMHGTLGWYPLTGRKMPTAKVILSTPITGVDYAEYTHSYALTSFLFTFDTTEGYSKYMDFTVKYLQTKNWDEAAKVYGFKNLDALNNAFQKWFQQEYRKRKYSR